MGYSGRIDGSVVRTVLSVAVSLVRPVDGGGRRIRLVVDDVDVNRSWTEVMRFAGVVAGVRSLPKVVNQKMFSIFFY